MNPVTRIDLQKLFVPPKGSHKGQNGRLLVIGGSHLFHAASLWALTVASRIVDLVHYCSVPENNQIVQNAKEEFRNGIVIHRDQVADYIEEDDCILIGPGMTRDKETKELTDRLLARYPHKQWVIDAGALQMMDVSLIPKNSILTPHQGEFLHAFTRELSDSGLASGQNLFDPLLTSPSIYSSVTPQSSSAARPVTELGKRSPQILPLADQENLVGFIAKKHNCIILLKGETDIVSSPAQSRTISGGNVGMTKGGTGDVLAGLVAALACKNDPFLAANAGSFINKAAGDELYKTVGPYFNASDLADQVPKAMQQLLFASD